MKDAQKPTYAFRDRFLLPIISALCLLALIAFVILMPDAPEAHQGVTSTDVIFSEVLSSNTLYPNAQGAYLDYIELRNLSQQDIDISSYKLSDNQDDIGYTFGPGSILPAGGYVCVYCSKDNSGGTYADFGISKSGETLYLYNSANVLIDCLEIPMLEDNIPYVYDDSRQWTVGTRATPGFDNTDEGYALWLLSQNIPQYCIHISELQASNRSSVLSASGELCDWIELTNCGTTTLNLSGCYLSDNEDNPFKWQLPNISVDPGAYRIIVCSGTGDNPLEAPFGLSKTGGVVQLCNAFGDIISKVSYPSLEADQSWQQMEDGSYIQSVQITPGFANTPAGYEAYTQTRGVLGQVAISEVMPSNSRYMLQSDGEYHDWVELENISSTPVNLSEYYLSNKADDPHLFPLPDYSLLPGDRVVIICSGNTALTGKYIHAPFTLNQAQCWVYLSHKEQGYSDYYRICDVPIQGSFGRRAGMNQLYYFQTPTPNQENTGGITGISKAPFVETPAGVYNNVSSVTVVLSGAGHIRYTLDGSVPTGNSPLYTQPLQLTKTTTLRCVCYENGKLPSDVITAGYIINENHKFPVVSISLNNEDIFGYSGIYTLYNQNREVPCNVSFYEDGGSFSIDCGIKMHGHTGLINPKKSFRINFRGRYGTPYLTYPVYGEDGPEVYDSLCIRAGQDYLFSFFREELFVSLCQDMTDNVLTQRSRYCVVYINGSYFGIYNLKEAFTELYYAQNRDVSADSVTILQAPVYPDTEIYSLMSYMRTHDLSVPENYAYICSKLNIDSIIDWMIIEGYSTNGDVQQNLRYFRSTENGNLFEPALYDLDWAFYYHVPFDTLLNPDTEWQHVRLLRPLFENSEFRDKFFSRLAYHLENTLSTENVLKRIDELENTLLEEMPRERNRWYGTMSYWKGNVNQLRSFISTRNHPADIVYRLQRYVWLSGEETQKYFGRWVP